MASGQRAAAAGWLRGDGTRGRVCWRAILGHDWAVDVVHRLADPARLVSRAQRHDRFCVLEYRDLAELESAGERFFCNVALLRVLYAHALVAAPRLSLGHFAALGPFLGDPRLGVAGGFLSLRRVLPDRYPVEDPVERYLVVENRVGDCSIMV